MEGSSDLLVLRAKVSEVSGLFHELQRNGRPTADIEAELRRLVRRLSKMETGE